MTNQKIIGLIVISTTLLMGTLGSTIVNITVPDVKDCFRASLMDTS